MRRVNAQNSHESLLWQIYLFLPHLLGELRLASLTSITRSASQHQRSSAH
jgi:hypothetical protein